MQRKEAISSALQVFSKPELTEQALSKKIVCPSCESVSCRKAGFNKGKQRYKCQECSRHFVLNSTFQKFEVANDFDFDSDVWTAQHLGLRVNSNRSEGRLFFADIKQSWLKTYIKKYTYYSANQKSFSSLYTYLGELKTFSRFLASSTLVENIDEITRIEVVDYVSYLNSNFQLANESKRVKIIALADFLRIGTINQWFDVPPYLIRPEDYAPKSKSLPRYIPEEVMQEFNQHLDSLPEPVIRMVLVIQECGLRIGELCQLPLDCLKSDSQGNQWIQFKRWKMKKEDSLPISNELSKVVQEQQKYIREHFGENFQYLFCSRSCDYREFKPVMKIMKSAGFIGFLKRLAEEFNIKDKSGKQWNFQSHQFRHTVGTRMINNGVPQHIIQRYLGHESPQMTMVYAHIHDETLRREINKYHELRVVNFQGETTELDETILSSNDDLEWFKKNVQARALEHGYCGRPKVLGDCDIPGFDGCYNCPFWRTNHNFLPVLKDTLERTNKVLNKAQSCGWELQVNKNKPIQENLEKVIRVLEENNEQED